MEQSSNIKLTGRSHNKDFFRFSETTDLDFDSLLRILNGDLAGCIFRKYLSSESCAVIAKNFWNQDSIRERTDGVPALAIGTNHYKKDLTAYFNEVAITKNHLENLFNKTENPVDYFIHSFENHLKKYNINLRLASYNEREAGKFVMRSCDAKKEYIIFPHDDIAQCRTAIQAGFEIENIPNYQIMAVNMCIENDNSGQVHIWNIQPDDLARTALDIKETGYPYPENLLKDFEEIYFPVNVGDVCCFNGRNIHAVKSKKKSDSYRTTISFFMGFIDDKTIIYWS